MPNRIISNIIAGQTVVSCAKEATVRSACSLMAQKRIGAILVVENNRTVGIFTEEVELARNVNHDALAAILVNGIPFVDGDNQGSLRQ